MRALFLSPLSTIFAAALLAAAATHAATFTVTTNADDGAGSLRQAITMAVSQDGDDVIEFDLLPSEIIMPLTELPALNPQSDEDRTIIRGPVFISGELLSGSEVGFRMITDNDVLEDLYIYSFPSHGVYIDGDNNRVSGCFVGNDGKSAKPNGGDGIYVASGMSNIIGFDEEDGTGNTIAGNTGSGIQTRFDAVQTIIAGNLIGVKFPGDEAMPNGNGGIFLNGTDAVVGGNSVEARNVISGNTGAGLFTSTEVERTQIVGNYIGTNVAGDAAIPNTTNGIVTVGNALEVLIGGPDDEDANVISGNNLDGIVLRGSMHTVIGNKIGTAANGTSALPNNGVGIELGGCSDTAIGGLTAGFANTIAYNGEEGVLIKDSSTRITVRGNAIYSNGGVGIELEPGGNADIAAPVITALGSVIGTAPPNTTVDIYRDFDDEGRAYLDTVTADGNGDFVSSADVSSLGEENITATATDGDGNTSEFSNAFPVPDDEEGEGAGGNTHTADQDGNGAINLSELLRVVQFFNSGGYACAVPPESTEDGYAPGAGNESCTPHASDYNAQDWAINLSELLRLIQFFNSGGYFYCPSENPPTEDGYCPGIA